MSNWIKLILKQHGWYFTPPAVLEKIQQLEGKHKPTFKPILGNPPFKVNEPC